jgi:hypothetical protein
VLEIPAKPTFGSNVGKQTAAWLTQVNVAIKSTGEDGAKASRFARGRIIPDPAGIKFGWGRSLCKRSVTVGTFTQRDDRTS